MNTLRTIEWVPAEAGSLIPGRVRYIDQTQLPGRLVTHETADLESLWTALRTLQVRGAPAIGIAAAMALAAAVQDSPASCPEELLADIHRASQRLASARPTAVNLFWALARLERKAHELRDPSVADIREALVREAIAIRDEDAAMCRAIGDHGAALLSGAEAVLTHCNAGGLATAEFGTALAPVYTAAEQGRNLHVYADETRPLLQGARLTAWELMQAGISVTLICDNTAAQVMKENRVQAVIVGADRIAANGDTANKVGTYGLAVLAHAHGIPFYVCAPTSTVDMATRDGNGIPIEERGEEEVTCGFGKRTAPEGVDVYAPAFDVTPASLIHAIVTEKGVARPDFASQFAAWLPPGLGPGAAGR